MNTFTKKSLHVALAGLGTLGLAGAADAVMVNPNGLGQVLIYPYYTVRSPAGAGLASYNTLLSVVNTTTSTKAVKVRFREGKASKEVLDFNVFLSPRDVWTAAVEPRGLDVNAPSGTPALPGAQIETTDRSCTIPNFIPGVPVPFRTGAFENDIIGEQGSKETDAEWTARNLDRLTEGYFEIFEMGTYANASLIAVAAKHASGVPKDCSFITDATATVGIQAPNGGLFGGATLINVLTGDAFTEDATALVQFTDIATYFTTTDANPNFSQTSPTIGAAVATSGAITTGAFGSGVLDAEKAATLALMKQTVANEFVGDAATLSGTDWVITFPTKHELVSETSVTPPFSNVLSATGSCDPAQLATWDREETPVTPGGPDFSPSPTPAGFALCWESNIISFKALKGSSIANVLGSANNYTVGTGFTSGWASLTFGKQTGAVFVQPSLFADDGAVQYDATNGVQFGGDQTFFGLPTIGFAVQTFVNGTLSDGAGRLIQSSYGGNFGHRYTGPQAAPIVPAP